MVNLAEGGVTGGVVVWRWVLDTAGTIAGDAGGEAGGCGRFESATRLCQRRLMSNEASVACDAAGAV